MIGNNFAHNTNTFSKAINPATGKPLEGEFYNAELEDVDKGCLLSQNVFPIYSQISNHNRALFMEEIASEIMNLGEDLIKRCCLETGLPEQRIIGERGRTVAQLNMFGKLIRDGSWLEATIDTADQDRVPIPKPDIRRMLIPMGPVVVFAASNFPLAFSTAGGDTASALASGNPVIVKAHSSHLGTSTLIAIAIKRAAKKCSIPDGVFSMFYGSGKIIGQALIKHPSVKAAGFTGSRNAGRLLFNIASSRDEPIPFFAEMGSINPTIIFPNALKKKSKEIASVLVDSINLGAGQFCTNPGLIIIMKTEGHDKFLSYLHDAISSSKPSVMLNENICESYELNKKSLLDEQNVKLLAESAIKNDNLNVGLPTIASVSADKFLQNAALSNEIFGPFSLVVLCYDKKELEEVIKKMEGQLTASVFFEKREILQYEMIINNLNHRVGRVIFNGVPTGVEVCDSMQHGGPYPASSDSRFTSVGTYAIKRFTRPISYQNLDDEYLPAELQNKNPSDIWRMLNGRLTKEII